MYKKFFATLFAIVILSVSISAFAGDTINITCSGKVMGTVPVIHGDNGRTLIQARTFSEIFNSDIFFQFNVMSIGCDNSYVAFTIGSNQYVTGSLDKLHNSTDGVYLTPSTDSATVLMDAAAVLIDGRTYVPFRAIIEGLGYNVEWNADTQTVNTSYRGRTEHYPIKFSVLSYKQAKIDRGTANLEKQNAAEAQAKINAFSNNSSSGSNCF